jgi:hypothetical protein
LVVLNPYRKRAKKTCFWQAKYYADSDHMKIQVSELLPTMPLKEEL